MYADNLLEWQHIIGRACNAIKVLTCLIHRCEIRMKIAKARGEMTNYIVCL